MLVFGQILDAIDQRPGAATKIIFGVFVNRTVAERRSFEHGLDFIGQLVSIFGNIGDCA